MSTSIDADVINLNINLDAAPVTSQGLGLTLHAGAATFPERFRVYTSSAQAQADSGVLTGAQLASIQRLFGSNNPPPSTIAGRVDFTLTAQESIVTIDNAVTGTYAIVINGVSYSYENTGGDTPAQIATGLAAVANADTAVSAVAASDVVTITALVAGVAFTVSATPEADTTVATTTPNASPADDLTTILGENSDWFGLVIDSRDRAVINAVAAWSESNRRLFLAQANDADAADASDTDNVLLDLTSRSYGFTAFNWYSNDAERMDGAYMSKLSADPDSTTTTWAHYTLVGVPIDPGLTQTQQATLLSRNANVYSSLFGNGATFEGKTVDGRFIDLRITAEWTRNRIQERIAQALLNASNANDKIPFTNQGLTRLGNVIVGLLLEGEEIGHFVPNSSEVEIPQLNQVTAADRANRCARYSFSVEPAGAIHKTRINGVITIPV